MNITRNSRSSSSSTAAKTLRDQIDQGWQHRINREIERAMAICVRLKQSMRLPPGDYRAADLDASVESGASIREVIGVGALYCSLVRSLRGPSQAASLLKELDAFCWDKDSFDSFYYHFEGAMVLFAKAEYAQALERFMSGIAHAQASWQRMVTWMNVTLCLENLGLPYENAMGETASSLRETPHGSMRDTVAGHLKALRMRHLFREGKIAEAIALSDEPEPIRAHFYSLWLRSLPYHDAYRPPSRTELPLFHTNRFFNRDYRLRSLLGVGHPADRADGFCGEFADRLYLWVWKWLQDPVAFPVQKIVQQLRFVDLDSQMHQMTAEDVALIRNSLLWLGLFDLKNEDNLRSLVRSLPAFSDECFPILEVEALVIQFATALREGSDSEAEGLSELILSHPLARRPELHWKALVDGLFHPNAAVPDSLREVVKHLRSVLPLSRQSGPQRIQVDLAQGLVQMPGEKAILSQALASALGLMKSQGKISVEEFAGVCFGIRTFNPLIHMPRIYNLMARLKALSAGIEVRVRQGQISCSADWTRFEFLRDSQCVQQLSREPDWLSFTLQQRGHSSDATQRTDAEDLDGARWDGLATREQIQKLLKRPRSTTNRILKRWMSDGKVVREGNARAARYRLKQWNDVTMEAPK